jgi:hypothetical protein
MVTRSPPPHFSLRRAVLLGLCLTGLVGGAFVMGSGLRALATPLECGDMPPEECALERELAVGFARRQVIAGAALALLGIALLFPLRDAYRPPPRP